MGRPAFPPNLKAKFVSGNYSSPGAKSHPGSDSADRAVCFKEPFCHQLPVRHGSHSGDLRLGRAHLRRQNTDRSPERLPSQDKKRQGAGVSRCCAHGVGSVRYRMTPYTAGCFAKALRKHWRNFTAQEFFWKCGNGDDFPLRCAPARDDSVWACFDSHALDAVASLARQQTKISGSGSINYCCWLAPVVAGASGSSSPESSTRTAEPGTISYIKSPFPTW
jgi:hypothetical protein